MLKTDLKITTNHLIGASIAAIGVYAFWRLKKGVSENINKINPASRENVVFQGVEAVAGADNVANTADVIFGAFDLINPFNESDRYAEEIFGIGDSNE